MSAPTINRRQFLASAGAAVALTTLPTSTVMLPIWLASSSPPLLPRRVLLRRLKVLLPN